MKVALIQINPLVGDVEGNARLIRQWSGRAFDQGAVLVVFPELALAGYPPRDLLLHADFLAAVHDEALALCEMVPTGVTLCFGAPWRPVDSDPASWSDDAPVTNSALLVRAGRLFARYDKRLLPTYDVFDELRYFAPGSAPLVIECEGIRVGVAICEDLWRGVDAGVLHRYARMPDPVEELVAKGAELIISPSASPFVLGKQRRQRAIITRHVEGHGVAIAAVNQVGGNDDLIFDGHGAVFVPTGGPGAPAGSARLVGAAHGFREEMLLVDLPSTREARAQLSPVADPLLEADEMQLLYEGLVIGVRDYCRKTGFSSCVLGLSGGIDSAVTASLAAAALGPDNVIGVAMPSRYSSPGSVSDARACAEALGLRFIEAPIRRPHEVLEDELRDVFRSIGASLDPGVTEENVQSRIRGLILMAISNKTGCILLTTGNKSELAVGYCTLYGDMNGGLAVLSDVTKIEVYQLARWMNANHTRCGFNAPPVPQATIDKPPSAELKPDQRDQDTLPPYEVLDEVVERYVERHEGIDRIISETGCPEAEVARIIRLIDINEYKRKQMPVGLKVTEVTFGPGRRRPIAQGYQSHRAGRREPAS